MGREVVAAKAVFREHTGFYIGSSMEEILDDIERSGEKRLHGQEMTLVPLTLDQLREQGPSDKGYEESIAQIRDGTYDSVYFGNEEGLL